MFKCCCAALLWMLPLAAPIYGQTPLPGNDSSHVFQANARIVVLDVVVSGKNHHPMTGLQQQDFRILEDGHPQTIKSFEEHISTQPPEAGLPDLPANVFTNVPRLKPAENVTVIVIDSLNTPLDDQKRVQAQILKYLKKPQTGQRIAIFTLASRLRLIQSFTDDPEVLAAALTKKKNAVGKQISPLLQSDAETASANETEAAMIEAHGADTAAALQQFMSNQSSVRSEVRLKLTLESFQALAQYLAGFPGRKNVIWFSGAFPVAIVPDPAGLDVFGSQRDDQLEVKKTDALLAAAQVAIYPVGADELSADSMYSAGADARLVTKSQLSRAPDPGQQRNANHAAMDVIAKETGGAAFYNTNGLSDALERVAKHGSNFYTLTYTSTNPASDGKFRKIQVDLVRPGYQLDYRRGYYADDSRNLRPVAAKPLDDLLSPFLRPGLPQSTQITFTLRAVRTPPPAGSPQAGDGPALKGPVTRYAVDLMIPEHALQFSIAADGNRRVSVNAGLVIYNRAGEALNWNLRRVNLNLNAARYSIVQANGINLYLEVDAPEAGDSLRAGVYDLNSLRESS